MDRQRNQVLRILNRGSATFWELAAEVDGTLRDLFVTLGTLLEEKKAVRRGAQFSLCGKTEEEPDWVAVADSFKETARLRPEPSNAFFQAAMRDEDVIVRVRMMHDRGDLAGSRVLLLGDDDLCSLALAATGLPERIVVLETDRRIVTFLSEIAERAGFPIEVIQYDCRDPLPRRLQGRFDAFLTDPVETEKGFLTFISRGVAALRHPGALYFGLTEMECPPERWLAFEKAILDMGLVLTDIKRKHAYYPEHPVNRKEYRGFRLLREAPFRLEPPTSDWYASSFIRCITVKRPRAAITERVGSGRRFYKDRNVMTLPP